MRSLLLWLYAKLKVIKVAKQSKKGQTSNSLMNKVEDLTPVYDKYKGKWVALKDDEATVIASGESAKEALAEAEKRGFENPILFKVPSKIISYVG